jgi:tetratricopeptide (TPR) repeat protein
MTKLSISLREDFCQSVQSSSVSTAIRLYEDALSSQSPANSKTLFSLSDALLMRFHLTGSMNDLNEGILRLREAVFLPSVPVPERIRCLNSLGAGLYLRFHQTDNVLDILRACAFCQEALKEDGKAHEALICGTELIDVFEQSGALEDLERAVGYLYTSLLLRPPPHPHRSRSLGNLASALLTRFKQKGNLGDLEDSIALRHEELILTPAPHAQRFASLNNLANALSTRFEQQRELTDLEESIALRREAMILTPASHLHRYSLLKSLANALSIQFERKGDFGDLEESIALHHEALVLRPAPHPDRVGSLSNLANGLVNRFEHKGMLSDLEESIALHHEALTLGPVSHPDRCGLLSNLANALSTRFQQKGDFGDLDESIALHREALILRPAPPNPDLSSVLLNNLAYALFVRFRQWKQLNDLEESIPLHREALILRPVPHALRWTSLNNLANALLVRFEEKEKLDDLEESIALYREAVILLPEPHPNRSHPLNNLALALQKIFEQKGEICDLEESITLYHEALVLKPVAHPLRSTLFTNLAVVLWMRFNQKGETCDLEQSMLHFSTASQYEAPSLLQQFDNSRKWTHCAVCSDHSSALAAYQNTINLLPRLASLDLNLEKRRMALFRGRDLASEACGYAIQVRDFDKAVEFLSAGRAVFWAQALQLCTPFDELHPAAPHLADKLRAISDALELASSLYDDFQPLYSDSQQVRNCKKVGEHYCSLNEDWNHTLAEVRRLKGFEDFLQPKSISKLQKASSNGPVIMLNATASRCDALIVTQDQVKHVALSGITANIVCDLGSDIQKALSPDGIRPIQNMLQALPQPINSRKGIKPFLGCHTVEDTIKEVLEHLWFTVAHPILQALNLKAVWLHTLIIILLLTCLIFQKSEIRPHIWWCSTGPFSFLPIHAAGIYQGDNTECVTDYAISSYTPTLDIILSKPPQIDHKPNVLAVIQSTMPRNRHLDLNFASEELNMIKRHVPPEWLTSLTSNADTTVANILSCLPRISFAHFACHGSQNIINPLNSALLLGDRDLTVSEIMQSHIPNASLAFLSACETAKGDELIPDEAMHLASAMLFAGYRGVVGTMWSVSSVFFASNCADSLIIQRSMHDEDGPKVADIFYGHIFGKQCESYPDATKAAIALDLAVNKLREEGASFQRWVPFIHLGF